MSEANKEGWNYIVDFTSLRRSPKWHYFKSDGRSLCGRAMIFNNASAELGNDDNSDNCAMCKRKLKKRNEAAQKEKEHDG